MASYPTRDVDRLHCPAVTYRCAIGSLQPAVPPCVACAYKICNFDVARDAYFADRVPNARPETCPRSSPSSSSSSPREWGDASSAGYGRGMRVLAVGDGDFSFSSAIADVVVPPPFSGSDDDDLDDDDDDDGGLVVATSYESANTLRSVYPDFDATLRRLTTTGRRLRGGRGGRVVVGYNVDATRLAETLPPIRASQCSKKYHRICWNFPCTAIPSGQDGQNDAMEHNRELVRQFVICALPLLDEGCGEVHMAHKTKPPYNQWSLENVALEGLMSEEEEEEEKEEEEEEDEEDEEDEDEEKKKEDDDDGRGGYRGGVDGGGKDGVVDEDSGLGIGGGGDGGDDVDPASTRRRRRRRSRHRRGRTLEYKGRMVFDRCIYRPYTPRKALDRKSFPCHDACVYVFGWKEEEDYDDDDEDGGDDGGGGNDADVGGGGGGDRWTTIPRMTGGPSRDDDDDDDDDDEKILPRSTTSSSVMPVTVELIDRVRSIHLACEKGRKTDGRRPAAADCIDEASFPPLFPSMERNRKRNDNGKRQRRKK